MKPSNSKLFHVILILITVTIPAAFSQVISFTPPYNIYSEGTTGGGDYELIDNNPNWTVAALGSPKLGTVTYNGSDYMQIARVSGNSGSADIYYTGPNSTFADFSGSVIFSDGDLGLMTSTGFGPILRSAGVGTSFSTVNKYFIAVRARGGVGTRSLGIYYGGGDNFITNSAWQVLDVVDLPSQLSFTAEYLLTFFAIGTEISASLYLLDSEGNISGSAIVSVYTDQATERADGRIAFRGGRYSAADQGILYRDFQITVIPEPSTAALLLIGGALLFARSRRRA